MYNEVRLVKIGKRGELFFWFRVGFVLVLKIILLL